MSLPSRLLGANPSIQVSTLLSGSLSTPSAKQAFNAFETNYQSIATQQVTSSTGTNLDFTSIPQTFKHLQLRGYVKLNGSSGNLSIRVGSSNTLDTGSNYAYHYYYATGTSIVSAASTNETTGYIGYYQSANSMWASFIVDIPDYWNTNKYKSIMSQQTSTHTTDGIVMLNSTSWRSKNAINTIRVFSADAIDFVQGSHVALYGIGG